jgi:hypothetical protein
MIPDTASPSNFHLQDFPPSPNYRHAATCLRNSSIIKFNYLNMSIAVNIFLHRNFCSGIPQKIKAASLLICIDIIHGLLPES